LISISDSPVIPSLQDGTGAIVLSNYEDTLEFFLIYFWLGGICLGDGVRFGNLIEIRFFVVSVLIHFDFPYGQAWIVWPDVSPGVCDDVSGAGHSGRTFGRDLDVT